MKDIVRAKHRTIVSPENNLLSSSSVSGRRPPNTASGATRTKLFAKRPIERENPARSILELEQKFSKVYVQSSSLVATQRSYSNYYTSNMDKKIVNIMQKLNSRFDPDRHRLKNENIVSSLR